MTLYLHAFQPDLPRLLRLAARERLLPPGDDPGYVVHAAFAAAFGKDASPKPWALLAPGQGGGAGGRLLAYSSRPLEELREHAATFADPTFAAPLRVDLAETREMRTRFPAGTRLGFCVRVRPVARTGRPVDGHPSAIDRGARGRERDVFLAQVDAMERAAVSVGGVSTESADGFPAPSRGAAPARVSRAECYVAWLDARLREGGASITCEGVDGAGGTCAARVDAFRFTRLLTRDRSGAHTRSQHPDGPDATITGTLVVHDEDAFSEGLARGIGRFRAFGFGMLLLSPARG